MPTPSVLTRLRQRRWWVIGLALVVAGAGGWFAFSPDPGSETERVTATVSSGTYKSTVSASGTITRQRQADLTVTSSGVVASVAVEVGATVEAGDVLATIDPATR